MHSIPFRPKAVLVAAMLSGAFVLPCAAQQMAGPMGFGASGAVAGGATVTMPVPSAAGRAGIATGTVVGSPNVSQVPAVPAFTSVPVAVGATALGGGTVTTTSSTIVSGPMLLASPSVSELRAMTFVSSTRGSLALPSAASGVAIYNPAAATLQSTTGTIETGSASSNPLAGNIAVASGEPLNMGPVGVALNSEFGGPTTTTTVVARAAVPVNTAVMGAGPAEPGILLMPPERSTRAMGASRSDLPPRADRN